MNLKEIKSCYLGPEVSPEEFIAEHLFLYLIRGKMVGYDGDKQYTLSPGECILVRKNHLARYNKQKVNDVFEKVVVIFDEAFLLEQFKMKPIITPAANIQSSFLPIDKSAIVDHYIESLSDGQDHEGQIKPQIAETKRVELLQILLNLHPEYAGILFDFGKPGKIDLKAFIQKNYKFNVSTERLAFLTGRSISAFKRDFKIIFRDTPSRWLVQRRLEEAYYLLKYKKMQVIDIYLDLGFEDLSHFSYAFKKKFGISPSHLNPVI